MTNKRFIVETVKIIDCDIDKSRIIKIITDTSELYSYDDLYELCDDLNKLAEKNEQLKQEIKQYWKCRDKWKQEAKELKKEADYFERKKCEYWNMYNEAHSDRIILKKENEELRKQIQNYEQLISDSYVGEEETLDGFIGKYVILEDELQKYING